MALLGKMEIPFILLMTKTEKLSKNILRSNIEKIKNAILNEWEEMPEYYLTSAVSGTGKKEILNFIQENNKLFKLI